MEVDPRYVWAVSTWTERDIPDQSGRTVVVTGASSGLGSRIAHVLASKGARLLLACRSPRRGEAARRGIVEAGHRAELVPLDLASLDSVRDAAAQIRDRCDDRLDTLINNAGVMGTPKRLTHDGFELQFGTNHLGHAALTWLLMPALRGQHGARVVTVSSMAARSGQLDVDDPCFRYRRYHPSAAYAQSKLANLLFALELDRRARQAGLSLISVAAHPGYAATPLAATMARSRGPGIGALSMEFVAELGNLFIAQSVRMGALPLLYAATAPDVQGGEYFGPAGLAQARGYPRRITPPPFGLDTELAARLWTTTGRMIGIDPAPA